MIVCEQTSLELVSLMPKLWLVSIMDVSKLEHCRWPVWAWTKWLLAEPLLLIEFLAAPLPLWPFVEVEFIFVNEAADEDDEEPPPPSFTFLLAFDFLLLCLGLVFLILLVVCDWSSENEFISLLSIGLVNVATWLILTSIVVRLSVL